MDLELLGLLVLLCWFGLSIFIVAIFEVIFMSSNPESSENNQDNKTLPFQ